MKRSELWVASACLQKDARGPQTITGAVCSPQYWDKDSLLPPSGRIKPSFHCLPVSFFYWFDVVSSSLVQLLFSENVRVSLMKTEDSFLLLQ